MPNSTQPLNTGYYAAKPQLMGFGGNRAVYRPGQGGGIQLDDPSGTGLAAGTQVYYDTAGQASRVVTPTTRKNVDLKKALGVAGATGLGALTGAALGGSKHKALGATLGALGGGAAGVGVLGSPVTTVRGTSEIEIPSLQATLAARGHQLQSSLAAHQAMLGSLGQRSSQYAGALQQYQQTPGETVTYKQGSTNSFEDCVLRGIEYGRSYVSR